MTVFKTWKRRLTLMRDGRWIQCIVCLAGWSMLGHSHPSLAQGIVFGFADCPPEVLGQPGEVKTFDVFATLTRESVVDTVIAWRISLTAEGGRISDITHTGVHVSTICRESTGGGVCDGERRVNEGFDLRNAWFTRTGLGTHFQDGREGAYSTVAMVAGSCRDTPDPERYVGPCEPYEENGEVFYRGSLSSAGTHTIARITLEARIPEGSEASILTIHYEDGFQPLGDTTAAFLASNDFQHGRQEACTIILRAGAVPARRRGDCDGDGEVRGVVTDAVYLLNYLFLGGEAPSCLAACDANSDGQVTGVVTDAVYLLTYNFLGGPPPAPPYPECEAFAGCENRCG